MNTLEHAPTEILKYIMFGVVDSTIAGPIPGHVNVLGDRWKARLCISEARYILTPGTPVIVFGRRGDELLVLTTYGLTEATS